MNNVMYGMAKAAWEWGGGNALSNSLDTMDREMKQICTDRQRDATLWLAQYFDAEGDKKTAEALRWVAKK